MKLVTKIEATLDLKSILSKSSGTITRHVTLFVGPDHKDMPKIMQAVRDARDLLRNDADMTMRLIKVRPEREADYRQAWATAAEKQMMNVYGIIKEAFASQRELSFTHEGEHIISPDEITDWTTPVPPQKPNPGSPLIPDPIPTPEVKGDPAPFEDAEEEEEEDDETLPVPDGQPPLL